MIKFFIDSSHLNNIIQRQEIKCYPPLPPPPPKTKSIEWSMLVYTQKELITLSLLKNFLNHRNFIGIPNCLRNTTIYFLLKNKKSDQISDQASNKSSRLKPISIYKKIIYLIYQSIEKLNYYNIA